MTRQASIRIPGETTATFCIYHQDTLFDTDLICRVSRRPL